jgi:hypothetical protein
MERNPTLRICYDRIIPAGHSLVSPVLHQMREEALLHATGAATPRQAFHDLDPSRIIPAPHMAIITAKSWPVGSHLKCRFLEGSPTQQAKVMHKAKLWEQYAHIYIDFVTTPDEQVRIAFQAGDDAGLRAVAAIALQRIPGEAGLAAVEAAVQDPIFEVRANAAAGPASVTMRSGLGRSANADRM